MMSVSIQKEDFNVSDELAILRNGNPHVGAVVSFVGTVRDVNSDVVMMELEHYPEMTEQSLIEIIARAKSRWSILNVRIVHRVGQLYPMDQIVFVAVAAKHRAEAFSACEFIMDYLKVQAPFWKKETTVSESSWVLAKEKDNLAIEKWEK